MTPTRVLDIARDMLIPVKTEHPNVSISDIWALTGAAAVEKTGGPKIPVGMGRVDQPDCNKCPPNGRLPDASQGAQHLRDVFYRMGFNDQEIVALSGAHTLGRCHQVSIQVVVCTYQLWRVNLIVINVWVRILLSHFIRPRRFLNRAAAVLTVRGPRIRSSLTTRTFPISLISSGHLASGMVLFSTRIHRVNS